MTKVTTAALQSRLHEEIPLTRSIGIRVEQYTGDSLTLCAPLEKNINHKSTAFGGSLYSVAVLSGWGLLYSRMQESGLHGHIVIQQSTVNYLQPVRGEICATCRMTSGGEFDRMVRIFKRKGMARIKLVSLISQDNETAVEFTGHYVVHK